MSLLSQKDREMAIEALEFYIAELEEDEYRPEYIQSYNALLNWIKLEYNKNN